MLRSRISVVLLAGTMATLAMQPALSWAEKDGKTLFGKCAGCHGADAAGKPAVKAPAIKDADAEKIKTTLAANAKHSRFKTLTDDQVKAIADYLKTLNK